MVEGKVVLAMIIKHFAFEKTELTGENGEEEAYKSMAVASVPCDRMRVKVKKVGLKKVWALDSGYRAFSSRTSRRYSTWCTAYLRFMPAVRCDAPMTF